MVLQFRRQRPRGCGRLFKILNIIIPATLHDINTNPKFLKSKNLNKYFINCATIFYNRKLQIYFLLAFEINKNNIDNIIINLKTIYPVQNNYLINKQYIKISDHGQHFFQYVPNINKSQLICDNINICNIFWQIV